VVPVIDKVVDEAFPQKQI
jgi:hypothetical protein